MESLKDKELEAKDIKVGMRKVIYSRDVKEAVLEFKDVLHRVDSYYNIPVQVFDKFENIFGDFEDGSNK